MLSVDDGDGVRTVTLDRPAAANALTPDGLDDLRTAVTGVEQPVVLLRGAGDAFCAGADLPTVAAVAGDPERDAESFLERGQRTARAIAESDAVVVAGVDGAARGGGVELALAADLRVATPDATFAESGVRLGLFGAWGGTARLPQVVGQGEALDLALSGRVVDADEARRMGLVSRVVEDPRDVAAGLADNDPAAMTAIKQRVRDGAPLADQERRECEAFVRLLERDPPALDRHRE